ncbi:MAG: DNA recombination protein RmuC [Paludibacteraceae bacterium]|nr:DNA recombination protein RmuC [Paludibacteraceae bacterium]
MNTLALVILTALVLVVLTLLIGFLRAYHAQQEKTEQILIQKNEAETRALLAQQTTERWQLKAEEESTKSQQLTQQLQETLTQISALKTEKNFLQEKLDNQIQQTEELQKRLTSEFENIANRVMKQRTEEFTATNQKQIGDMLNPLKEKIVAFEQTVQSTYEKELREKVSLGEELKKLTEMNRQMSLDATNLTNALKGDAKKQGNWGEVILERVLERSGLTLGQEYRREDVVEGSNGEVIRPDVIIYLPDNKHIIIDSKVSLVAYERYVSSEEDILREKAIKEHILSIRNHVKGLSEKNYQNARNINTPDFVLLFMPIEAAFAAAVQNDTELFSYAWEKHIVIVSPTTLLATLRTIASIWKQENQTKNAQEIARLSGTLYDKLVGFAEDMEKIKLNIERADKAYDEAVKKLKDGKGNVIRTAEKIKELGAKTGNKALPEAFQVD